MAEEATINTDGTQEMPPVGEAPMAPPIPEDIPDDAEIPVEVIGEVAKGIDPALYIFALVVIVIGLAIYFRSRKNDEGDDFFTELDGDKVGLTCLVRNLFEIVPDLTQIMFPRLHTCIHAYSSISSFRKQLMNTIRSRKSVCRLAGSRDRLLLPGHSNNKLDLTAFWLRP
jgi:hypothetical protein